MNTPSSLAPLVDRYLSLRRTLGYDLRTDESALRSFARFADREAPSRSITTALALQWVTQSKSTERSYLSHRLRAIRSFAQFCAAIDPRTQVPPKGLFHARGKRRQPHLYTTQQVRQIMRCARRLPPDGSHLRPHVFVTLVGLLSCTGMRLGEALRLQMADFDPRGHALRVPAYKFSCERVLPLHPSSVRALRRYLRLRQRWCSGTHFFVDADGQALKPAKLRETFQAITRSIVPNGARARPRWHDFRHSFTSRVIAYWNKRDEPVAHHLLLLARYLGHKSFQETWWYVSPARSDLEAAAARFKAYQHNSDPS
jgi:integrase